MRIDDLILFGRTAPEKSKKYGVKVCGAGYSPEMREFIRIYPIPIHCKISAREMITVDVNRSKFDSRRESWALKTRDDKSLLCSLGKRTGDEIRSILEARISSIETLNKEKASLGVIKPDSFELIIKNRKGFFAAVEKDPSQMTLFDDFEESFKDDIAFKTANDYFKAPYIFINDSKQKYIQLREWGLYELMRKYPHKITSDYIKRSLHLCDEKEVFFVIGNTNQHRNTWLVIKTFSFDKKSRQLKMFGN